MRWNEHEHPRHPAKAPGSQGGRFREAWVGSLSQRLETPGERLRAGQRAVESLFGVDLPEPIESHKPGAAAEVDLHSGEIRYNPAEERRLLRYRELGMSLGGRLSYEHDVWIEAGAHEAAHSLAHHHLTIEQQVEALRRGASAAGLPEVPADERMAGTYSWSTRVEMESSPDFRQGTGQLAHHLSGYASYSNFETFAEALTEYALSDDPRPFAQAVGDYVASVLEAR